MAQTEEEMNLFRPPLVQASTVLNRALFSKTVDLAAARVKDAANIAKYRRLLETGKEILRVERVSAVVEDPDETLRKQGRKCILLRPSTEPEGCELTTHDSPHFKARLCADSVLIVPETWGPVLKEAVQKEDLSVIPYVLKLDYDYWTYRTSCPSSSSL